jgi:exportin-2 (importin alpha re-exporter)
MLTEPSVRAWPPLYTALRQLFSEPQHFAKSSADDQNAGFTEIDFEEQAAGYQAAYSRLAASESKEVDAVAWVGNPVEYAQKELERLASERPEVRGLIQAGGGGL